MNKHPSGRPIRREDKRDYSMGGRSREGFLNWRLNEDVRPRHDTHAVGFISYPPEDTFWHGMEARKK